MRLHSENPESFIHALATSISKDPASLENWRCLHIEHSETSLFEHREAVLNQLKKIHTGIDCDVVQSADKDIFFISRNLNEEELHFIANEFLNAAAIQEENTPAYAIYDLFMDWRNVQELLNAKTVEPKIAAIKPALHHFGDTASLEEIFAEAKKLRKVRMPLHVMIVEDDALTRRLVANIFKTNYALITAANAQEAVANYLLHAPDIVFLDIGLPDASGFDVLHQIMASDKDAYVVMFSGNSYLDNVTSALSNGACGFIAKPFKKEKMQHYIQDSAMHHHKYNA